MKSKIILLFIALSANMGVMFASDTAIDGIFYDFDIEKATASVTYQGNKYDSYKSEYSGSIIIPSSVIYENQTYTVTSIGKFSFRDCDDLTSITLPNSITSIGISAFLDCDGLTTFTIPASVIEIGNTAFYSCDQLISINVDELNPQYSSLDGVLFNKDKTTLIQYPINKADKEYSIPNTVNTIGEYSFAKGLNLNKIIIPNSVITIETAAFNSCTNLTSADLPHTIINIGESAFMHCRSLTSVIIPDNVTNISKWAFCECRSLQTLTIGKNVTIIGRQAFDFCTSLLSIICKAEIPPTIETLYSDNEIDQEIFRDLDKSICKLYVQKEVVEDYKNHWQWKQFNNILPIEEYQSIDEIQYNCTQTSNKTLYNGQILILRGDKTYTLQGQEVKYHP